MRRRATTPGPCHKPNESLVTRPMKKRRSRFGVVIVMSVALTTAACAWKPYVVTRAIRYATGERTRFHPITPLASSLKPYRAIEVTPLESLLPGRIPPAMKKYLDDRISGELKQVTSSPQIVASAPVTFAGVVVPEPDSAVRTLVIDGFVDDYDPGSLPLRIVELGFNHVAVTVRVRLRDKTSGAIVGAASITTEDNRATGTTRTAINRVAKRIRTFVNSGYGR